jgi:hypothetical protein
VPVTDGLQKIDGHPYSGSFSSDNPPFKLPILPDFFSLSPVGPVSGEDLTLEKQILRYVAEGNF